MLRIYFRNVIMFWICMIGPTTYMQAQGISKDIMTTSGTMISTENISLVWTIGEISIRDHSSETARVSEGFLAGELTPISTSIFQLPLRSGIVFPNPVRDQLQLFIPYSDLFEEVHLFDMKGNRTQSIYDKEAQTIDVEGLKPGIYILIIHTKHKRILRHKITKV